MKLLVLLTIPLLVSCAGGFDFEIPGTGINANTRIGHFIETPMPTETSQYGAFTTFREEVPVIPAK